MKTVAVVLEEMGRPAPYAESKPLQLEDLELTPPDECEVLVEIVAAGLCHSDLSVINGSRPRVMPMVLGHEAAGIVREVGAGVRDFQSDDHVVFSYVPVCGRCTCCQSGRAALCERGAVANTEGSLLSGKRHFSRSNGQELHHHLGVSAFSQYTVAAEESLVKISKSLPLDKAALFGCAVMTGVGAVVNTANIQAGQSVAVFGMGGVGLSSIMGAKASGAFPIVAVDLLDSKLDLAKNAGATHAVNANDHDAIEAVKNITGGGASVTFEAVGSEIVLAQAYAATARGGKTVCMGLPHPSKMLSIPAVSLVAEERTILGSYMGSSVPRRDIPRFIAMYEAGLLPVDLLQSSTLGLNDINAAFDDLAAGTVARQTVLMS
ncbi:zinc-dependent alcohol dehydrogenase family protein [Thalassoglobus polymorphus]|uniref:Alcohol dehydrogenase D n=1 Tax=Thalassoglobus polymorphus TaxID=2527994 RepID=A0A517QMF0_9PLAN|nr:zinc-dependent alcohol dehydrogenase family protein [Thalassoglobus polymorphus]QDT32781.1 Putative alcohol dehydrogenase D [Thalassoglobus polymorphus]